MCLVVWGFPHSSVSKESAYNVGNPGSIPGSRKSAKEGIGYPLQYSWASRVAQLIKIPFSYLLQTNFTQLLGLISVLFICSLLNCLFVSRIFSNKINQMIEQNIMKQMLKELNDLFIPYCFVT